MAGTLAVRIAPYGAPPPCVCLQVVLPAAPDVSVPDWFFERTGVEVKAQWLAALRRREEQSQFVTRAMRERAAGPAAAAGGQAGQAEGEGHRAMCGRVG